MVDTKIFQRVKAQFHSLEVVDRVSETQLQVSENYNFIFNFDMSI